MALLESTCLQFGDTDAGGGGEGEFPVHHGDAGEEVVGDEEVPVQVREIDGRGELGGGGDGAGCLGHAAEHDLEVQTPGEFDHLVRVAETAALHEFDVDAVEKTDGAPDIGQPLDGFVTDEGQRAALAEPGLVLDTVHGEGLLHQDHAMVPEPVNHVQGPESLGPALIRIDGDREVRDGADGLDEFLVVGRAHLDFQDVELAGALERLFADDLGRVDADSEGRGRSLRGVVSPDAVPGCAEHLAYEVVERDVNGGFSRTVARRQAVQILEDVVQAERIVELREVHLLQEGGHGVHALAQIGRHGCFSITCKSLIRNLHLHVRRGVAAIGGDGERMLELKFVGVETKLHPPRSCNDGFRILQGIAGGRRPGPIRGPAPAASDRQPGSYGRQSRHFQEFPPVMLFHSLFVVIRICQCRIQAFLLVDEGKDAGSEKVAARVVGIVVRVVRPETADLHQTQRVDEAPVAEIESDVGDLRRRGIVPAEENQVAGLQVFGAENPLSRTGLRTGITRDDDVMHEQDRADKAAAVRPLGGHAGPDVREAVHGQCGSQDGLGALVQTGAPGGFPLREVAAEVAGAAVGEPDLPVPALPAEVAEPVARHHVGDGGGALGRLGPHHAGECRHDDLRCGVPGMILLERQ